MYDRQWIFDKCSSQHNWGQVLVHREYNGSTEGLKWLRGRHCKSCRQRKFKIIDSFLCSTNKVKRMNPIEHFWWVIDRKVGSGAHALLSMVIGYGLVSNGQVCTVNLTADDTSQFWIYQRRNQQHLNQNFTLSRSLCRPSEWLPDAKYGGLT